MTYFAHSDDSDYLALYRPAGFLSRTRFSPEEIRLGRPGSESFPEYWQVYATLIHEWCHHLQCVGTTFGRYYLDATIESGVLASVALKGLFEAHRKEELRRPLFEYMHTIGMLGAVHGMLYIGWLRRIALEAHLGQSTFPIRKSYNVDGPRFQSSPVVLLEDEPFVVGAKALMEAHAAIIEGHVALQLLGGRKQDAVHEVYNRSLKAKPVFATTFVVSERLRPDNFPLDLTCILIDLALNPGELWCKRAKRVRWEDVHPGWRFLAAVECLRLEKRLYDVKKPNWKELITWVCKTLGWQHPSTAFSRSRAVSSFGLDRAKRLRMRRPLAFALPHTYFGDLYRTFPIFPGAYKPRRSEAFLNSDLNIDSQFALWQETAPLFESTVFEVLHSTTISCPFHGSQIQPGVACQGHGCTFAQTFQIAFGITPDDYYSIPLKNAEPE